MSNTKNSPVKNFKTPIRWGGFVPLVIITAATVLYFWLFFDRHLKYGLEVGATAANGAHVDIGSLKTRLLHGEILVGKVEVGNPKEPMKNRVEIETMRFKLRLPPLIKMKVVVEDSSILGIKYGTQRTYSAAIPVAPKAASQFSEQVMSGFEKVLKEKVGDGEVERVGSLLEGKNLTGQAIQLGEDSNSMKGIRAAQSLIETSSKDLDAKMKALPDEKAIAGVKAKIDAIGAVKINNVDDAGRLLNDLKSVESDVSSMTNKATDAGNSAAQVSTNVTQSVSGIEKAIDDDVAYVKKKLQIPNLNLKDLTTPLLGPKLGQLLEQALYYVELARKYMPPKKKGEKDPVAVQERKKGRDFEFGQRATYPGFLLEKAVITSALSEDPTQGDAKGEIIGVNTNPSVYGKPTTAVLTANFPRAKVSGARVNINIDHVTEVAKESGSFQVDSFPVEEWVLSEGSPFFLKVLKAAGRGGLEMRFQDDEFSVEMKSLLAQVNYDLKSDNAKLEGILKRALSNFSSFNLTARVTGKSGKIDMFMSSDLGERLGGAIRQEVQAQLELANQEIRKKVTAEVAEKRKALDQLLDGFKKNTLGPLDSKVKGVNDLKGQLQAQVDRINKEKDNLIKGKAQQELDKVKQNIKLPKF